MDAAQESGLRTTWIERGRASFECQNWPREKGSPPGGERKRMERCGKKSTPPPPLPLKKGGGFGSTVVQRERVQH